MKKVLSIVLVLALALFCASAETAAVDFDIPETARAGEAEKSDYTLTLSGKGDITIENAGSYLISGELEGTLIVDSSADKKVELKLNGACIRGGIWVKNAEKNVTVYTCSGSVNVIYDTAQTEAAEDSPNAALYSRDDLKFKGEGELYVYSACRRGIYSSDDIEVISGTLYILSAEDGLRAKDSVTIEGGSVTVKSEGDGICSANDEDAENGNVIITGGKISVLSGGGYTENTAVHSDNMFGGFRGYRGYSQTSSSSSEAGVSAKGIKASGYISVTGGEIFVNSNDDAIHSNGNVTVSGGEIEIYSGDDALHADSVLTVSGGSILINTCYEGLEGTVVNIEGGEIRLTASDDGINAAGDDDTVTQSSSSSSAYGYGGRGGFSDSNGLGEINISGGYTVVMAGGDGIDSNNTVSMSGGTLIVYGPTDNGNGALDYETEFSYTGGMILAVGSSGMAESVTSCENGAVLAFRLSMNADTLLTIEDAEGNSVLAFAAPKSYSCVVFVSEELVSGQTYSVYSGGERSGIITDCIYASGSTENGKLLGSLSAK